MNIFDSIAKTFRGTKAPTASQITTLIARADAEVEAAEAEVKAVAARLPDAVLSGEAGVSAHRSAARLAAERLSYAKQAREVLASKFAATEAEEAEAARRSAYEKAVAAQNAARSDLLAKYPIAVAELIRLRELVGEADRLAAIANGDLPAGATRLLETEAVRDVPATPERIVSEELIDQWVTSAGTPVDAARVTRREGKRGALYAESSFGPRPVACQLVKMRRVKREPWCPPAYGARLADMTLPDLHAAPVPTPSPVTELLPLAGTAEAAE
ncbi:hypothetical protein V5F49_03665 [Xanthobacter sp. V3C-3]|uniref:hypothetical protein n=1 Tax=Xanthobacter lutulentifluminis TaxID=3119935 RepID=UPI00372BDCC1